MIKDAKIEYYYCLDSRGGTGKRPRFFITPKKYFDKEGFMLDDHFDIGIPHFDNIADSTYEYIGENNPIVIMLSDGRFIYRDMSGEIEATYERQRLIGVEKSPNIVATDLCFICKSPATTEYITNSRVINLCSACFAYRRGFTI